MRSNKGCGCDSYTPKDHEPDWFAKAEPGRFCEISTVPCNEYYLFNAAPIFTKGRKKRKCGKIYGCVCDKRFSEFLDPHLCEGRRHHGCEHPLELQLAKNPTCSPRCCLGSYPQYIEAGHRAKCGCPEPWAHPFSNEKRAGPAASKGACACEEHALPLPCRHSSLSSPSGRDCPKQKPPIERRGDTSQSGYAQQLAFGAIALANRSRVGFGAGCCAVGSISTQPSAPSRPAIPVLGLSCVEEPEECDELEQPCGRRFLNQDRTRQFISGHYGYGSRVAGRCKPDDCIIHC